MGDPNCFVFYDDLFRFELMVFLYDFCFKYFDDCRFIVFDPIESCSWVGRQALYFCLNGFKRLIPIDKNIFFIEFGRSFFRSLGLLFLWTDAFLKDTFDGFAYQCASLFSQFIV